MLVLSLSDSGTAVLQKTRNNSFLFDNKNHFGRKALEKNLRESDFTLQNLKRKLQSKGLKSIMTGILCPHHFTRFMPLILKRLRRQILRFILRTEGKCFWHEIQHAVAIEETATEFASSVKETTQISLKFSTKMSKIFFIELGVAITYIKPLANWLLGYFYSCQLLACACSLSIFS